MTTPNEPGERRRLERPPGERYAPAPPAAEPPPRSPGASLALAQAIALAGAAAIVVLGNILEVDFGLIAVAAFVGWLIGAASRQARARLGGRTPLLAGALAAESVLLGQAGLWLLARAQGGVLDPMTYFGQLFGIVVPLEFGAAIAAAWWAAR